MANLEQITEPQTGTELNTNLLLAISVIVYVLQKLSQIRKPENG